MTIRRADYHRVACRQGRAPLDCQLGYCAGSTRAGLAAVLALLGATADSFAAARTRLAKLTLVHSSPKVVRAATEALGQVLQAKAQQVVPAAWGQGTVPPPGATPARRSVARDGVPVHTEARWRAYKRGRVYPPPPHPSPTPPGQEEVRAQAIASVGDRAEAADFGQRLWCAAARRGVLTAPEGIVIADGAHWIGNVADEPFPEATPSVDWYHAGHSVWQATHASYGAGTPRAKRWAQRRLGEPWAGPVANVLHALGKAPPREAVQEASTYAT